MIVEGDVRDPEAVERAVVNADAVVSVLGHTDSSKDDVLAVGGRNIIDAMEAHGVKRFITLVGAGVRHEDDDVGLGGKVMGFLLKTMAGDLLEDSKRHVEALYASDLMDYRARTAAHRGRTHRRLPSGIYLARDAGYDFAGRRRCLHAAVGNQRGIRPRDADRHGTEHELNVSPFD